MTASRFAGLNGIVTGAASGMGRATAERLAAEGARILLCDRDARVEGVAMAIAAAGGDVAARVIDVADESAIADAVAATAPDVFFANAGIFDGWDDPLDASVAVWDQVLRVNLIAPFLAIKHAGRAMAARGGGAILCTASVGGLRAGGGGCAYSASKAGVINLVQTAAVALAGGNVRVNAICPGLIGTAMSRPIFEAAAASGVAPGQLNPLRRAGSVEEIAAAAAFLLSGDASYINGQAIAIDGGLSSALPSRPAAHGTGAKNQAQ